MTPYLYTGNNVYKEIHFSVSFSQKCTLKKRPLSTDLRCMNVLDTAERAFTSLNFPNSETSPLMLVDTGRVWVLPCPLDLSMRSGRNERLI